VQRVVVVVVADLFQKLFRQDLLVASLFRNFLLAERIMRSYNCTPVSSPKLPPTFQHPMWSVLALSMLFYKFRLLRCHLSQNHGGVLQSSGVGIFVVSGELAVQSQQRRTMVHDTHSCSQHSLVLEQTSGS